jgi:ABC-type Fe3+/spermidine/putrescine transport system ATPase subunit
MAVIRDGAIEQCGVPERVHEQPATAFVARFVGANVLPGNVAPDGDIIVGAGRLDVGGRNGFAPGAEVVVTIRPERVRVLPGETAGANRLPGVVTTRRYGGLHSDVRVRVSGQEVRVRCPTASAPEPGVPVTVELPPDALTVLAP